MIAKIEDNLDSLSFSEVQSLLKRMCKFLGFRLFHRPISFAPLDICWYLDVDDDTIVFLEGRNRDEFKTAKVLLKGILNSRIFKLRIISTFDGADKIISNPFYSLNLCALKIKLDLLA